MSSVLADCTSSGKANDLISGACENQRRVAFVTMGCAKNEVDSAHMGKILQKAGYTLVDEPDQADVVIVNTCSFIQSATEESLEAIFDAANLSRVTSGECALVVAGCLPARYGDELVQELPEVDAFVACEDEAKIDQVLAALTSAPDDKSQQTEQGYPSGSDVAETYADEANAACEAYDAHEAHEAEGADELVDDVDGLDNQLADDELVDDGSSLTFDPVEPHLSFAYVKISDGCDRFCSYCTIPFIRGRYHSYSFEQIYDEVAAHVASGVQEIDLVAQDTGRWGEDLTPARDLAWLADKLSEAFPDTWFRLLYIQPEGVSDRLLEVMAQRDNLCSYLDIPLQHISGHLLKSMHRRGDRTSVVTLLEKIHHYLPEATLRTTLMTGFPGETEEDFEELCEFVSEGFFDYIGIFAYSREEGTRAFDLPNQVDEDEKIDRARQLRELADSICSAKIAERIGSQLEVLVEAIEDDGQVVGRAQCQAPEVDGSTFLDRGTPGQKLRVIIDDALMYEMEGTVVDG